MTRSERIEKFSKGLHHIYLPYYYYLSNNLSNNWQPISGLRPIQEQAELYRLGRSEKSHLPCLCKEQPCTQHPFGRPVTKARPGLSYHNYGIATDWGYFENEERYVNLPLEDNRWSEYIAVCRSAKLQVIEWERPHNQLKLPVNINVVYDAFLDGGARGAATCIMEVCT